MFVGLLTSALVKWAVLGAILSIGACTIYKQIGDRAVNKALVKGQKEKVEQRKDALETAQKRKKEYIKKSAKYPVKGKGLTPEQKLENAAKRFQ